jgi:predicted metallo-beta-lactamase superfamily hydrolase
LTQNGGIKLGEEIVVVPLAAESVGVRSLSVLVRTSDTGILIDPGVALGSRGGLHPHPTEYRVLAQRLAAIRSAAQEAEIIVISHYHFDHLVPFFENHAFFWSSREIASALYGDRRIWCKDIQNKVNRSQRKRGVAFEQAARSVAREVVFADNQVLRIGDTIIQFSPAVPHGEEGTFLGFVVMTAIHSHGVSIVHASDVQGPMVSETTNWILKQKPHLLILAGPPTYLSPERVSPLLITKAAKNLQRLVAQIPTVILDHHLQRDADWREWLAPIQEPLEAVGHRVVSVAGVAGLPEQLLEARRPELYSAEPVSRAFEAWVRKVKRGRALAPPPLEE